MANELGVPTEDEGPASDIKICTEGRRPPAWGLAVVELWDGGDGGMEERV